MNPANDLFLLMVNLSQLHDSDRIIGLFLEAVQFTFRPVSVEFAREPLPGESDRIEIRTRNAFYGTIILHQTDQLEQSSRDLIYNAVQMLALVLERLESENRLQNERNGIEDLANQRLEKLRETIEELEQTKQSSLHLIDELTREIEKRNEVEAALKDSEDRFRALHNASFGGIVIHDKGFILDCNQGLSDITGFAKEELIGMDGLLLIAETSRENVRQRIREGFEKPYEAMGVRKNGEQYPIRLQARNIPYKGKMVRSTEFRDISEQKKAEADILVAMEMAEENNRLKSAFLANMSHELRTPMNAIMGFSDLMTEADCEEKNRYAEIILKSSGQLLKLIDDVVYFSRLQSEKIQVNRVPFYPWLIVTEVYQMFDLPQFRKNLSFSLSLPEINKEVQIFSDPDKTKQVLINLVSNALQYTLAGEVSMGFLVQEQWVEFFVSDTGIGISEEEQKRLFEHFYRGEEAISRAIGGTGLGLNIAQELAALLGGSIRVESVPGQGSRFSFVLPAETIKDLIPVQPEPVPVSPEIGHLVVLIAEDDPDNLLFLRTLLKKYTKKVDYAINGKEAVDMILNDHYDLVLMDLKMPVMSGYEAIGVIRNQRPLLPVIAQTAYAQPEERRFALQSGFTDYLVKPITRHALLEIFRKHVNKD